MFTTLIVQPIFNLLVFIYAILPGHNFGLAIIIFTIVVRLLMWPLIKKQLHQVKVMRALQPEIKRIKKAAAGDKRQESMLMMELYKERGVNPFGQIGVILLQIPILFGLYAGLRRILQDPHQIVSFAYPFLQNFSWIKELGADIHRFDSSLFGLVDLTRSALGPKGVYWPAMIIVIGSAVIQYFQSKQLTPDDKETRSLRRILKESSQNGKTPEQSEINAAVGRSTRLFLPGLIFLFTVNIASALSLYWLVGGLVAFIQQSIILKSDATEMENTPTRKDDVIEGEVIPKPKPAKTKSATARKKRRK